MAKQSYSKDDIRRIVKEENVNFLRLMFTDLFGTIKNVEVPVSQLDKLLDNKLMFDGSSSMGLFGSKKVTCTCILTYQLG